MLQFLRMLIASIREYPLYAWVLWSLYLLLVLFILFTPRGGAHDW